MNNAARRAGRIINRIEEGVIALLFAVMTLVTFSQVIARYVFNAGAVWALELTVYCFAWLVLFGISYGIKHYSHLGVDAFVKLFSRGKQRIFGLVVVAACLLYAGIMLVGAWEYVGKLYKIGIESEDLPIPQWVPMAILPVAMGLLIIRLLQVGWQIWQGQRTTLLADEARAAIEDLMQQEDEPQPPGPRA